MGKTIIYSGIHNYFEHNSVQNNEQIDQLYNIDFMRIGENSEQFIELIFDHSIENAYKPSYFKLN